ncbi:beta-lactamase family protein [Kribbella sandramycini]|uniref:Beta-lactamase family protein n=1 Tax=Kribbella sandramycini TaxID=60450 RepID=A0A7Y4KW24_9ACTN|nr:serine hydrolase domain-containing protein [Kribbella sandramycini]MBB6567656.1 CubicO group peptidase (beta-lactamase class C family) [Kribbella sandramycini]NOL39743.1 beta-lactamase family protein [Kribbella sandramycini]
MSEPTLVPSLDQVADQLVALVGEHKLPSLAVAVAHGNQVQARGFGTADLEGRPATGDTPYLLASVTKPLVGTLCALLAQQGLIDLDEPLGDRLPWLDEKNRATVRQALSHTAGFGRYWDFAYGEPTPELEYVVQRYGVQIRPPGTRFEYANLGYGVLEPWLLAATEQPLAELLRRHLFEPFGLTSGAFGPGAGGPQAAVQYTAEKLLPYPTIYSSHSAAGMAWMSAADLARFGQLHVKGTTALTPASAAAVRRPGVAPASKGADVYGLGLNVRRPGGVEVLTHLGDMCGVGASIAILPEQGVSVAAVINRTGSCLQARTACELLLDGLVSRIGSDDGPPPSAVRAIGEWAGYAETPTGRVPLRLGVTADEAAWVEVAGGARIPARLEADESYDVMFAADVQLPTPDAMLASPWLELALDVQTDRLVGSARAVKHGEAGDRVGNCLTHWCELERVQ